MILPEYGRNVLQMVDYLKTIDDKEERTKAAKAVVFTMATLNPQLRESLEFKHKLWDHLYILADYKLDVESPFPAPSPEDMAAKPLPVPYPKLKGQLAYYGFFVDQAIAALAEMADSDEKRRMILGLANQMKRNYVLYNKDSVEDVVIIRDLVRMSDGKLVLPETTRLVESREIIPPVRWQKKNQRR